MFPKEPALEDHFSIPKLDTIPPLFHEKELHRGLTDRFKNKLDSHAFDKNGHHRNGFKGGDSATLLVGRFVLIEVKNAALCL